ncbi:hypothetical protein AB4Z42_05035 [Mycobacterium sp. 2YAF39]|uniref:hypothetical protein n=1 Tax=Mycobacterium sp. 2YAF39 TaxID=3233033 RepID=UPI003F98EE50
MLTAARKVLAFEMTIAEWLGTAAMLAVPYVLIGMVWTAVAGDHLGYQGHARILSILASIVSWPALLIAVVCTI